MKTTFAKSAVTLGFALLAIPAFADKGTQEHDMGNMNMDCQKQMGNMKGMENMKHDCMSSTSGAVAPMSDGEVMNIDKDNHKITLKHGRIEHMKMPPMTMAFAVKDASLLSNVNVGDKVKFRLENVNGVATVTALSTRK